jgi:hypothetical protein
VQDGLIGPRIGSHRRLLQPIPAGSDAIAATNAKGLAIAAIDDGRVVHARCERNQAGKPLETTIAILDGKHDYDFAYTLPAR